ncbi:MAG: DNA topoisomerase (ATP-hydrolyzing) subunit B [Mycoplasmataceae bacterium]|nr:DNA topoisomerase (ATP-hydrolyzing) subunit B [Mycoplasmataceae bacterium]
MENKDNKEKLEQEKAYNASSIQVLKGLEAVRKRPGMYIGSTGVDGLHHMIWEIIDNAIDEIASGYADSLTCTLTKDGAIRVEDNGRGIPVEIHPEEGKPTVEVVLTVLHAGGKFDNNAYKTSGGLHGVGASVTNALSKYMKVWVVRNNIEYYIDFIDGGKLNTPLKKLGNVEKIQGTTVEFFPDFTVMEKCPFEHDKIVSRLKKLAYLNKTAHITFVDEQLNTKETFFYPDGIKAYILDINRDKEKLFDMVVYGEKEVSTKSANRVDPNDPSVPLTFMIKVEVAFQYNSSYANSIYTFCNNIDTIDGGTHEDGFKLALVKVINNYALRNKFLKEVDDKFSKEDVTEGLAAIISVKHPDPQYDGQTKTKLGNTEIRPVVNAVTSEIFEKFLNENPTEAAKIIAKIIQAKEARIKSQQAREAVRRKSPFDSGSLPGKLADCSTKDHTISELYIVEGDSAGGSAKLGRDRYYQAILPLRGKILNVEKAKTNRIFESEEIGALITGIGAGATPEFHIENIRYDKVIIMTDADVDGAHIRILLLTFFFRYMKPLIEQGHVYAAVPPLYKFVEDKKVLYAYSDAELEELKKAAKPNAKIDIQRYKGLGEMNPEQLWETTMDPTVRKLHKFTIDDAIEADQQFSFLMGDDVLPRKDFISKNAKFVKNLDI